MVKSKAIKREVTEDAPDDRASKRVKRSRADDEPSESIDMAKPEKVYKREEETEDVKECCSTSPGISEVKLSSTSTMAFKDSLQRFHYSSATTTSSLDSSSTAATLESLTQKQIKHTPLPPPLDPLHPHHTTPSSPNTSPKHHLLHLPVVLKPLPDLLAPNLITLFVGSNPGLRTATTSHHYAHPSNSFYRTLHLSNITPHLLSPAQDSHLLLHSLGSTNLVARATRDVRGLAKGEMENGVGALEEKVGRWKPESVCFVGKGVWEAVWRGRYGRGFRRGEFCWGWQGGGENMGVRRMSGGEEGEGLERGDGGGEGGGEEEEEEEEEKEEEEGDDWMGARVYVTCSTSGLSASLRPAEKEAIWKPFGEWIVKRRAERERKKKEKERGRQKGMLERSG